MAAMPKHTHDQPATARSGTAAQRVASAAELAALMGRFATSDGVHATALERVWLMRF